MRVPCRWLADHVEIGVGEVPIAKIASQLEERLTLAGLEVEARYVVPPVSGLVVGQVRSVAAHPNADHLSVCEVDTGSETLDIVCGAPNVAAEQTVAVILPGSRLPSGAAIEIRKLRGVASHGMICSKAELGLEEKSPGIWILDPAWALEPGADLAEALEFDDAILDISITSNRPDLLGVYGIAREVAALLRAPLAPLGLDVDESDPPAADLVSVELEDPRDAPRYCARVLSDVTVAPSPPWFQHRLTKAGMRPLSNVIDATNYVMLELGQPLHPFDADRLSNRIHVRRARPGERFRTLDGADHDLMDGVLLITDGEELLALAGVMGGERSEIRSTTSRVLLEAATFHHAVIRHAARALGLRTEASDRFSRGIDAQGVDTASLRAAHWMQKLTGCRLHRGSADAYPHPGTSWTIRLRPERIDCLLGIAVPQTDVLDILTRLGLTCERTDAGIDAAIPSRRADLQREADLVEEVGRIYGYDRIPSLSPHAPLRAGRKDPVERLKDRVRDLLVGLGMDEVVNDGFERAAWSDAMGWTSDDRILLRNPMLDSQGALRVALLPGLLATAETNLHQGIDGARLFEVGRVFPKAKGEHDAVAGVLFGRTHVPLCGKRDVDAPAAKGLLFAMLEALRLEDLRLDTTRTPPYITAGGGGTILAGEDGVGVFGSLSLDVSQRLPIGSEILVFEVDLHATRDATRPQRPFAPLSRFPASKRDLSLLVPPGVSEQRIRDVIAAVAEVERLLLYDEYSGDQVGANKRSLTYELVLRSSERTLTDNEVAAIVADVEQQLEKLGVVLRR